MKMKSVKIFVIALIGVSLSLSFFTGCASKESKTADRDIAYETRGMTTMATTAGIVSGRSQSADGASSAAAQRTTRMIVSWMQPTPGLYHQAPVRGRASRHITLFLPTGRSYSMPT